MRPTLRQLEIFVAVRETGTFSGAGTRLGLVQPAISLAIRKMEDGFGFKLFDRSGPRLRMTGEGEALLEHAHRILGDVDRLGRHMQEMRQLGSGRLRIGAAPFVASFVLPSLVVRFLASYPGVQIHVVEDSSQNVLKRVRSGDVDVGLAAGNHGFDDLEVKSLADQPMVACVSENHALAKRKLLSWAQVLDEPLVLFPEGYNQRLLLNEVARRVGHTPRVVCEAESANFIAALVQAGHGVAFMFAAIAATIAGIRAVPIEGTPAIPVTVCRAKEQIRSLAARAFYAGAS